MVWRNRPSPHLPDPRWMDSMGSRTFDGLRFRTASQPSSTTRIRIRNGQHHRHRSGNNHDSDNDHFRQLGHQVPRWISVEIPPPWCIPCPLPCRTPLNLFYVRALLGILPPNATAGQLGTDTVRSDHLLAVHVASSCIHKNFPEKPKSYNNTNCERVTKL